MSDQTTRAIDLGNTVITDDLTTKLRAAGEHEAAKEIMRLRMDIHALKGDKMRLIMALRAIGHTANREAESYD